MNWSSKMNWTSKVLVWRVRGTILGRGSCFCNLFEKINERMPLFTTNFTLEELVTQISPVHFHIIQQPPGYTSPRQTPDTAASRDEINSLSKSSPPSMMAPTPTTEPIRCMAKISPVDSLSLSLAMRSKYRHGSNVICHFSRLLGVAWLIWILGTRCKLNYNVQTSLLEPAGQCWRKDDLEYLHCSLDFPDKIEAINWQLYWSYFGPYTTEGPRHWFAM